ncbi:UDP-glycosyltransferase 89A2-like [Solanum pennellii]|uniref:UDP-glycosyltransferase 89A2-like n=1 Tax=Solanum pennellii TaxID=28526 RepID=A0ABM1GWC0_SOLPN|nr:UDP-glycosyltransferase 89A2-like [Solanum pennellii]
MSSSKNGVHILILPYPAQGHILALLDLTHQLLLHGFKITVLVTPKNVPILDPLISTHSSVEILVFPFPGHPSLPSGVENIKDVGNSGNAPIIAGLSKLRGPIVEWFKAQSNPPVAIIYDFFLGWTLDLAQEIGVPGIVFYGVGALLISIFFDVWKNIEAYKGLGFVEFNGLPKSPRFVKEHLPSVFLKFKEDDPTWEIVRNGFIANGKSCGSIFNTFETLDSEYLGFLKKQMGHERVYSIGPINLVGGPGRNGKCDDNANEKIFTWLNECPNESVLYVAFGSQKLLTKAQMEALTIGLEKSEVRFILVAKQLSAQQEEQGFGSVPLGFEERVLGRGLVIKGWAPQVEILGHRAVGGFLSHCGWNSVMEAIVAGVIILGWPMEADQFINTWLLVDNTKTSFRVCEGSDSVPDPIELGRKINEAMNNDLFKKRAKELKDEAYEAVKIGGSSKRDLDAIVTELAQLKS